MAWDNDNWRSMYHTWRIHYHVLTVVMRLWQLTEHVSYLRGVSPCSDRCHWTMTTDRACCISKGWIIMLCPLSWDDENWRSMFHTRGRYSHALTVVIRRWHIFWMNNHALSFIMRRWKLMEHASYLRNTLPFTDRCYETMTTDGACFMTEKYIVIPWPLLSDHANWQSMYILEGVSPCSERCHGTMTTDRAYCIS